MSNHFAEIVNVIKIIQDKHGKNVDLTDEITCPVCKNRITYTIHSNGEIRGKCQTPDCISWMVGSDK